MHSWRLIIRIILKPLGKYASKHHTYWQRPQFANSGLWEQSKCFGENAIIEITVVGCKTFQILL